MATASGHAPATPTIKGRLRPRPNRNILQARSILIAIPSLVIALVLSVFFLSLVFPRVRRAIRRFRKRHPRLDSAYRSWRGKARTKRREKKRRRLAPL